jgi:hypothetical protein
MRGEGLQQRRENSALRYSRSLLRGSTEMQPLPRCNLAAEPAGTEVIRFSINALPPRCSATSCFHGLSPRLHDTLAREALGVDGLKDL